jgi:hypothetical protein
MSPLSDFLFDPNRRAVQWDVLRVLGKPRRIFAVECQVLAIEDSQANREGQYARCPTPLAQQMPVCESLLALIGNASGKTGGDKCFEKFVELWHH